MDTFAAYVWEPAVVKINALTAATEAACLILSVDETVRRFICLGTGSEGTEAFKLALPVTIRLSNRPKSGAFVMNEAHCIELCSSFLFWLLS